MPNQITADGIETKTLNEIISDLQTAMETIYGPNTDFSPNSPDGQLINNIAQQIRDELDLTEQVYAGFDPDQAIGTTLDARVALNGIKREAGTYSTTDVTITTSGACSLVGLDGSDAPVGGEFIVADAAGTQWVLINSYDFPVSASTSLTFRAVDIGAILTTANTLTTPVTIVVNVTSVNNPAAQLSTGDTEEQDSALKIRRQQSVAITSVGFYDALVAALENVPDIDGVAVYENTTGATDSDGIPEHSIWVIVGGSADNADIATAIYAKRSAGSGMKGAVTYDIVRANGSTFTVQWDVVSAEVLYFRFTIGAITGDISVTGTTHNTTTIIDAISSTTGMAAGYLVRGTDIPAGATIVTVDSPTQITISAACTGNHTAEAITVVPIVISTLKTAVAAAFSAEVYETLNINAMSSLVQGINPNVLLTSVGLSADGISYYNTLTPTTKAKQFTLATGQIVIL